jgi:hypothetical protein
MKSKVITHIELVELFRDALYYEINISNYILIILFPIRYFVSFIASDPLFEIKVILIIIAGAAVLFTPFILYVLIKEKKYGWIIFYFVLIILPLLLGYMIFKDTLAFEAALLFPLGFFYLYCYIIKFQVDKWITDYNWHSTRLEQIRDKEERIKNELL